MAAPIKKFKFGKVEAAVWENDKNGQKYYTTILSKSYLQGKEWKQTTSFASTDLRDLYILLGSMLSKQIKDIPLSKPNIQMADNATVAQEVFEGDEVPF